MLRIDDGTMPADNSVPFAAALAQTNDRQFANPTEWRCVTERAVSDDEMRDAEFAWNAVQALKSNAIVICRDRHGRCGRRTDEPSGIGHCGWRVKKPTAQWRRRCFLPFADGLRAVAEAGIGYRSAGRFHSR